MPWLADTNVLVYRFDHRFPEKQRRATELLRGGIADGEARIAHQGIVEFVAATTRPTRGGGPPILSRAEALRQAENLMNQFPVLYPTGEQLRLGIRGAATYALSWFDAQMWACAEHHGLSVLYTEDLQPGQVIGTVRIEDPFR